MTTPLLPASRLPPTPTHRYGERGYGPRVYGAPRYGAPRPDHRP
jgi:hypothetical protein